MNIINLKNIIGILLTNIIIKFNIKCLLHRFRNNILINFDEFYLMII